MGRRRGTSGNGGSGNGSLVFNFSIFAEDTDLQSIVDSDPLPNVALYENAVENLEFRNINDGSGSFLSEYLYAPSASLRVVDNGDTLAISFTDSAGNPLVVANDPFAPMGTVVPSFNIPALGVDIDSLESVTENLFLLADLPNPGSGADISAASELDVDPDIVGTAGDDQLIGTDLNEEILGLAGDDTLRGKGDNDTLRGGLGDDLLAGGHGDDSLVGEEGYDILRGGNGNDFLNGVGDDDFLRGGRGEDTLVGGLGADILLGNRGGDLIYGDLELLPSPTFNFPTLGSADLLYGGAGDDTLFGEGDDDTLLGGAGNDELDGGVGNDLLAGAVRGGTNFDTLTGGEGADQFILGRENSSSNRSFYQGSGSATITDFNLEEGDTILVAGDVNDYNLANQVFIGLDGVASLSTEISLNGDLIALVQGVEQSNVVLTEFELSLVFSS